MNELIIVGLCVTTISFSYVLFYKIVRGHLVKLPMLLILFFQLLFYLGFKLFDFSGLEGKYELVVNLLMVLLGVYIIFVPVCFIKEEKILLGNKHSHAIYITFSIICMVIIAWVMVELIIS